MKEIFSKKEIYIVTIKKPFVFITERRVYCTID